MNYLHYKTKNHSPRVGDPSPSRDPDLPNMCSKMGGCCCDFKWRQNI